MSDWQQLLYRWAQFWEPCMAPQEESTERLEALRTCRAKKSSVARMCRSQACDMHLGILDTQLLLHAKPLPCHT